MGKALAHAIQSVSRPILPKKKNHSKDKKKSTKIQLKSKNGNTKLESKINQLSKMNQLSKIKKKLSKLEFKIKNKKKSLPDEDDNEESDNEDTTQDDDFLTTHNIFYGHEELRGGINYGKSSVVSYMDVFYGSDPTRSRNTQGEESYNTTLKAKMESSETMDDEEAEATVIDMQYATVMGKQTDIPIDKRKRFSTWLIFNSHMLGFYEGVHGITRDVNYGI